MHEWWYAWRQPYGLRIILALTFLGHGLVNLGLSPMYAFHTQMVGWANQILTTIGAPFHLPIPQFLTGLGWAEVIVTLLLLVLQGRALLTLLIILMGYLLTVGMLAWYGYGASGYHWLGIAEILRRMPWFLTALTLALWIRTQQLRPHLVRYALACAFLAHGLSSLGFLGFRKGHIDLALNLIPEEYVLDFVWATGISDTIIGTLLVTGILPALALLLGTLWITAVVAVSFLSSVPEGIFRLGFLMIALWTIANRHKAFPRGMWYPLK